MIMDKVNLIKVNPSFYIKGTGKLEFNLEKAQIGKLSISPDLFPEQKISNFIEDRIESIPGLNVESLEVENLKLKFKGSYPDKTFYEEGE
jgi:hypothetical protein